MNYIAIDLETTGLNPKTDRIIEIGAVKVINNSITESFETFVDPGRVLPERIIELTGITQEQLIGAPSREAAMQALLDFIGEDTESPLLGHNILFDFSFLKKDFVYMGLKYEAQGIDTLRIARKYLPEIPSRALPALCSHYGIVTQSHRAKSDAIAAHELYRILMREFGGLEDADVIFAPRRLNYQVKRQRPITAHQKERLTKMAALYRYELPYDVNELTKNEADRIMDQLRSTYGNRVQA